MKKTLLGAALSIVLVSGAIADDSMSKLDKAIKKFDRTGETERCVSPYRIRQTRVVDDNHIIFEMVGRKTLLNVLPRKCHSLGFQETILYTVRGGQLCRGDIFSVLGHGGRTSNSCVFGDFEQLEKKEKTEKSAKEKTD